MPCSWPRSAAVTAWASRRINLSQMRGRFTHSGTLVPGMRWNWVNTTRHFCLFWWCEPVVGGSHRWSEKGGADVTAHPLGQPRQSSGPLTITTATTAAAAVPILIIVSSKVIIIIIYYYAKAAQHYCTAFNTSPTTINLLRIGGEYLTRQVKALSDRGK